MADDMRLVHPISRWSPTEDVLIPFTRMVMDWERTPPHGARGYVSLLERARRITKDAALNAMEDFMDGGPARTHVGQTTSSLLSSGLSASGIRVPEINTGSLVALSL